MHPFIIKFSDEKIYRGKVYKSYDTIALRKQLSIKITIDGINNKSWFEICEEMVEEGLKKRYDFENTHIKKLKLKITHGWLWVVWNKLWIL